MINVTKDFLSLDYCVRTEYFRNILLEAARNGERVYQNAFNAINNLPCVRELKGKVTIRELFSEYWDMFYDYYNPLGLIRPAIKDNVDAMIHCKDFSKGYLTYECPNCKNLVNIGLSCNSRFCSSCGNRYREERALSISKTVISKPHRQFVFSIAKELRKYFIEPDDRDNLLDILFEAVNEAFNLLLDSSIAKREHRQFGYMLFLHTYGRDLKWNPHIHALICEGYMDKNDIFHKYYFFPYERLRKSFMYSLHNKMYIYMKKNKTKDEYDKFYKLTKSLEKRYPDGYYAHGPKLKNKNNNRVSIKKLTSYIARYASHPAIAESRILKVDYTNATITYFYDPHEDDLLDEDDPNRLGRQEITESVFVFMKKLVRHIPNKGFHNIRYCGFYAKHTNQDLSKLKKLYTTMELNKMKSNINWNKKMKLTYNYEPLLCTCGHYMKFCPKMSFFPNKKGVPKQLSFYDYDEDGELYA